MAYKPGTGPGSSTFGSRKDKIGEDVLKAGKTALETFTPLGDVKTAQEAYAAYQRGDIGEAALNSALIALGYTPLGPLARPLGRLGKRVIRDKDMLLPALTDKDYAGLVARETIMGKGPLAGKSVGARVVDKDSDYYDGFNPLDLLMMQNKKIDPAEYSLFFRGDRNPSVAQKIAEEGNIMNTTSLAPDLQVSRRGYTKDRGKSGGLSVFPLRQKDLNEYLDVPISKQEDLPVKTIDEYARGKQQYTIPTDKLEELIMKSDYEPFSTTGMASLTQENSEKALEMLNDYYKSFVGTKSNNRYE